MSGRASCRDPNGLRVPCVRCAIGDPARRVRARYRDEDGRRGLQDTRAKGRGPARRQQQGRRRVLERR